MLQSVSNINILQNVICDTFKRIFLCVFKYHMSEQFQQYRVNVCTACFMSTRKRTQVFSHQFCSNVRIKHINKQVHAVVGSRARLLIPLLMCIYTTFLKPVIMNKKMCPSVLSIVSFVFVAKGPKQKLSSV